LILSWAGGRHLSSKGLGEMTIYVGLQARRAVYFDSYAQLPEHVVDSLFQLWQQGFLKVDLSTVKDDTP
jgi:hypothetical protein